MGRWLSADAARCVSLFGLKLRMVRRKDVRTACMAWLPAAAHIGRHSRSPSRPAEPCALGSRTVCAPRRSAGTAWWVLPQAADLAGRQRTQRKFVRQRSPARQVRQGIVPTTPAYYLRITLPQIHAWFLLTCSKCCLMLTALRRSAAGSLVPVCCGTIVRWRGRIRHHCGCCGVRTRLHPIFRLHMLSRGLTCDVF